MRVFTHSKLDHNNQQQPRGPGPEADGRQEAAPGCLGRRRQHHARPQQFRLHRQLSPLVDHRGRRQRGPDGPGSLQDEASGPGDRGMG